MTSPVRFLEEIQGVRLVGCTKIDEDFFNEEFPDREDNLDLQDFIIFCAKVSNPVGQHDLEGKNRLLRYFIDHAHWSPLEMANVVLEITTSRDLSRQLIRHRSMVPQEFSQRYQDVRKQGEESAFCIREARLQDPTNRQNSINMESDDARALEWYDRQRKLLDHVQTDYAWALENGIAKESARVVLPEGMTMTKVYMNGSIRSWLHYCRLREAHGTQKEHMLIARACADSLSKVFPFIKQ